MPKLPDLTGYGYGGITLIVACYIVLQSLKQRRPWLKDHMTEAVCTLAAALVGTNLWFPPAFVFLASSVNVAALILGAHDIMKAQANRPPDKPAV